MNLTEKFEGCILAGAIGDAFGSAYENQPYQKTSDTVYYPFGKPRLSPEFDWRITDDTQLTLATCEAIIECGEVSAACMAEKFLHYYKTKKLTGLGASTLKALQELDFGAHWSQSGRRGEYAAGNGAAMRMAPLAFVSGELNRQHVEEVSRITHHHDEAYVGALSIVMAIQAINTQEWTGNETIFQLLIKKLPDTKVRDRFIAIPSLHKETSIQTISEQFGKSGYVVESVPLALFAASKVQELGLEKMFQELAAVGGDTDTNCSIAGQIAGTLIGSKQIPAHLLEKLKTLPEYSWIKNTIDKFTTNKIFCL